MNTEWKRKNPFVGEIRRFLKRFRIMEVKTESFGEMHEVETPMGGKRYGATGRDVVIIRLTGYWRDHE